MGEAGIGKSSLVEALRAGLPASGRMLTGYCDDLATPRTLGPFRDLAGSVGAELSQAVRDGDDRDRVLAALHAELSWPEHPTVLVIEDVHWADDATLDALRFLIRRIADLPAVLILTRSSSRNCSPRPSYIQHGASASRARSWTRSWPGSGSWTRRSRTRSSSWPVIGRVAVRRGQPEAASLLWTAWDLAVKSSELQRTGPVAVARAEAAWLHGDRASVRDIALPVYQEAVRLDDRVHQAELGYWLAKAGQRVEPPGDHPYAGQAAGRWREAAALWESAGCRYEQAGALAESQEPEHMLTALGLLDARDQ